MAFTFRRRPHIRKPAAFVHFNQVEVREHGAVVLEAILFDHFGNEAVGFVVVPAAFANETVEDEENIDKNDENGSSSPPRIRAAGTDVMKTPFAGVARLVSRHSMITIGVVCCFCFCGRMEAQLIVQPTFTTLDDPLGAQGTFAYGVSGNTVVGYYMDSSGDAHGFTYNIPTATFTTVNAPGSVNTYFFGISGSTIVGETAAGGFQYNGSTFTTVTGPSNAPATPHGTSGSTVVGIYQNRSGATEGFSYNGSGYTVVTDPLAPNVSFQGTYALGVSGNTVVGYYGGTVDHGFTFNGLTYMTLDDPLGTQGSTAWGISGGNIVGYYVDGNFVDHGFVYDGVGFTTLDDPLGGDGDLLGTMALGISGDAVVGVYRDANNVAHGFITTVPEPKGLFFVPVVGAMAAWRWKLRTWNAEHRGENPKSEFASSRE